MEMKAIKNSLLGEVCYEIDHPSGLKIFVIPKEGYKSTYAVFGTKYGSVDTCFRLSGEENFITVPAGIAHFLEHKLFESEELDAFELFSKTGASANAFTSFDSTCYLFKCSDKFEESLEILLNFVKSPFFTQATVEKEQGIIGQEIRMYQDSPDWQLLFNLLRTVYVNNPVRIDIGGTVESIAEINADLLYSCYNTFYNLSNMALCVTGNVTPEKVLEIADRAVKTEAPVEFESCFPDEPNQPSSDYVEQKMNVGIKKFAVGFKEVCGGVPDAARRACMDVLLEIIAGKTSRLYAALLDEKLINADFGKEYFCGRGFALPMVTGESAQPEKVRDALFAEIEKLRKDGIDEDSFETARRKLYGREVMGFNDIEDVANNAVKAHFYGESVFDVAEAYRSMTKEQLETLLSNALSKETACLSVIS